MPTTLTVGAGKQFATISAAVAASKAGDTVEVQAGTYTNDFLDIRHDLTLRAVGGMVKMVATVSPPNGKAVITEQGKVSISGFEISGSRVADNNGAAIRYEGGHLKLDGVYFHHNQNGLLAATDPDGTISISRSEFAHNGSGDGRTHNIYVNRVDRLTIDSSYFHDASVGHEIKSRAENTVITNNRIFDNAGSASYNINLPNGGVATVRGNVIEQGVNSQNPGMITFGDEGALHAANSLTVSGNLFVNHLARSSLGIWNTTSVEAQVSDNRLFGLSAAQFVKGPAQVQGTQILGADPGLDTSPGHTPPAAPSADGSTMRFTDLSGHRATVAPIAAGERVHEAPETGLDHAVAQRVDEAGVLHVSTPVWNGVRVVNVQDATGRDYSIENVLEVNGTWSGGGSIEIHDAKRGTLALDRGDHRVEVHARSNAPEANLNRFTVSSGSGSDTVVVEGDGAKTQALFRAGGGKDSFTFLGQGTAHFVGGVGEAVFRGGDGADIVAFGAGAATVWGGAGADRFQFGAGDGLARIQDFGAGDVVALDRSLQASMRQGTEDGAAVLEFGDASHRLVIAGVPAFDAKTIEWL